MGSIVSNARRGANSAYEHGWNYGHELEMDTIGTAVGGAIGTFIGGVTCGSTNSKLGSAVGGAIGLTAGKCLSKVTVGVIDDVVGEKGTCKNISGGAFGYMVMPYGFAVGMAAGVVMEISTLCNKPHHK